MSKLINYFRNARNQQIENIYFLVEYIFRVLMCMMKCIREAL